MEGCRHFFHVKPSKFRSDISKLSCFSRCPQCGTNTEDLWLCLSCSALLCGREVKRDMLGHCKETSHPLTVSTASLQIWCYACDEDFDVLVDGIADGKAKSKAEEVASSIRQVVTRKIGKRSETQTRVAPVVKEISQTEGIRPGAQPRGLNNLGNTCFFNSSLQCLNATAPLLSSLPSAPPGPVTAAFTRVTAAMHSKGREVNPKELHSAVVAKHKQFRGFGQHDSHEMLRCMLDAMTMEQTKAKVIPSAVEKVFGGKLLNSVLCATCVRSGREQTMSRSLDPIMDISLEMTKRASNRRGETLHDILQQWRTQLLPSDFTDPRHEFRAATESSIAGDVGGDASIDGCLSAFTRCEPLVDRDNLYDCPRCRERTPALRRLLIYELPKVLVIHIKRFSSHGRSPTKLTSFVSYPLTLDIGPYCVAFAGRSVPTYRLYAVSVHSGGMHGGHYVAYVRHAGAWFHCSDTHVSKVSENEVMRLQAYVLFYQAEDEYEPSTAAEEETEESKKHSPKPNSLYEEHMEHDFDG